MEREWLEVVLQIAARQPLDPEAVARLEGQPLRSGRRAKVRDGVAVIPVHRPIFRRANLGPDQRHAVFDGLCHFRLVARPWPALRNAGDRRLVG